MTGAPEAAASLLARALTEPPAASHRAEVLSASSAARRRSAPIRRAPWSTCVRRSAIAPRARAARRAGCRAAQRACGTLGGERSCSSSRGRSSSSAIRETELDVATAARGGADHGPEVQRGALRRARCAARGARPGADRRLGRRARHARDSRAAPGRAGGAAGGAHRGGPAGARPRAPRRSRARRCGRRPASRCGRSSRATSTRTPRDWIAEGLEVARARGLASGPAHGAPVPRRAAPIAWATWRRRGRCPPGGRARGQEFHSLAAFCAAATSVAGARRARSSSSEARGCRSTSWATPASTRASRMPWSPSRAGSSRWLAGDASGGARTISRGRARSFAYSGWRPGAASASLLLGSRPSAIELADEELARARRFGAPRGSGSPCVLPGSATAVKRGLEPLGGVGPGAARLAGFARARDLALRAWRRAPARPAARRTPVHR